MKVKIELSGGLELLFDNKKSLELDVKEGQTVGDIIEDLKDNHIKENPELFYVDNSL